MKTRLAFLAFVALGGSLLGADDILDTLDDHLSFSLFGGAVSARVSGLLDLEAYDVQLPPPGLVFDDRRFSFDPRLTTFLDAQIGPYIYAFAQARVDRGFDPGAENPEVRMEEYAFRVAPWSDGRFSLQVGKFATVVGSWVGRHDSWENPFITAPAPYENLTGIWDSGAPDSAATLLSWAHVTPGDPDADKYFRVPIIWGPSYASGVSASGQLGKFDYAVEMKNTSLSSRPEVWDATVTGFEHPAFDGRFGFRPNEMWNLGVSFSRGYYLRPEAAAFLPPGAGLNDYRELVLAQDISFAWHHWQVWAEFFETRFEVPEIGNADTFAYYLEAKYKFTPQLFGALRWNQQLFDTIPTDNGLERWGNELKRLDAALGYRLSAHVQLKIQYSIAEEQAAPHDYSHLVAGQLTVKF